MKAAVYRAYGGPEVVTLEEMARPVPGQGEVLVKVHATSVTTADWRLRSADFPGLTLPGRLMFGFFRPRKPVLGNDFAGVVEEVGAGVTRVKPGDRVMGTRMLGTHVEYVSVKESGALLPIPDGMSDAEAAALPFGALAALVFLRDHAQVQPGERVLVTGASGGVGIYAVQIARAMGAEVTALAATDKHEMLRALGADHVVDRRQVDITRSAARFDVVLDPVSAMRFRGARRVLTARGRYVPLEFGLREIGQALWTALRRGPRVRVGISGDRRADLEEVLRLWTAGDLRPVIGRSFPFARIREAHAHVQARDRRGAVIVEMTPRLAAAA